MLKLCLFEFGCSCCAGAVPAAPGSTCPVPPAGSGAATGSCGLGGRHPSLQGSGGPQHVGCCMICWCQQSWPCHQQRVPHCIVQLRTEAPLCCHRCCSRTSQRTPSSLLGSGASPSLTAAAFWQFQFVSWLCNTKSHADHICTSCTWPCAVSAAWCPEPLPTSPQLWHVQLSCIGLQVERANEEVYEAVREHFAALTTGLLPGMVSRSDP